MLIERKEEIKDILEKYYIPIQNEYNFISLGGSIALNIMDLIPFKPIKDIDIISSQYINKLEIKNKIFNIPTYKIIDKFNLNEYNSYQYSVDDLRLDLYIYPSATYYYIEYNNLLLRLSPPEQIIQAKLLKYNHNPKHIPDIQNVLNKLYIN